MLLSTNRLTNFWKDKNLGICHKRISWKGSFQVRWFRLFWWCKWSCGDAVPHRFLNLSKCLNEPQFNTAISYYTVSEFGANSGQTEHSCPVSSEQFISKPIENSYCPDIEIFTFRNGVLNHFRNQVLTSTGISNL